VTYQAVEGQSAMLRLVLSGESTEAVSVILNSADGTASGEYYTWCRDICGCPCCFLRMLFAPFATCTGDS
jgi:hypothetical protein